MQSESSMGRFSPGSLPVLLRVPQMEEESPAPGIVADEPPKYRWRTRLGLAALMIIAIVWLFPSVRTPIMTKLLDRNERNANSDDGRLGISMEETPLPPLQSSAPPAATLAFETDRETGALSDPLLDMASPQAGFPSGDEAASVDTAQMTEANSLTKSEKVPTLEGSRTPVEEPGEFWLTPSRGTP